MAVEDLVKVYETLRSLVPDSGINVSYYMVLAGFLILAGFTAFLLASVAVKSLLLTFRKPPSYAIKLILILGLALLLLGIIMP